MLQEAKRAASSVLSMQLGTRVLLGVLISMSGLLAVLRTLQVGGKNSALAAMHDDTLRYPYLVLVPGISVWYPWTLLTAAFCETTLVEFLVSVVSLPLCAHYLEQQWGSVELLRFTGIVVVASNAVAWFISFVLFAVTRRDVFLFGTQYHGLEGLQTGFLVAFTQLLPHHQVQLLGLKYKLRIRDLTMAFVTFSNVMCILGWPSPFILIQFGWLSAFFYLRFYQHNESTGGRGDRSDGFAAIHWFPPLLHRPVGFVGDALYAGARRVRLVPEADDGPTYDDLELNMAPAQGGRAEAERRRMMALQALDQRLAAGRPAGAPGAMPEKPAPAATVAEPAEPVGPKPATPEVSIPAPPGAAAGGEPAPHA